MLTFFPFQLSPFQQIQFSGRGIFGLKAKCFGTILYRTRVLIGVYPSCRYSLLFLSMIKIIRINCFFFCMLCTCIDFVYASSYIEETPGYCYEGRDKLFLVIVPSLNPDLSISLVFLLGSSQMSAICHRISPPRSVARQENLDTSSSIHWICVSVFFSSTQGTSLHYLCYSSV